MLLNNDIGKVLFEHFVYNLVWMIEQATDHAVVGALE
jgi:hypothetical protein